MDKVNRRTTLKLMGMGAALLMASGRVRAQGTPTADQVIQGKDPRLIVHNSRTGVLETPLELLREHERTPKEILFIRNNQVLPQGKTLEPIAPDGWLISVEGMAQNLHLPHTPHKPSPPPPGGPRPRAWSSRRMTCTTSSGKRTRAAPSLASRQLPFPSTPTQWASR